MEPIRIKTISKIVWGFIIVLVVFIGYIVLKKFLPDDYQFTFVEPKEETEKIVDYTESKIKTIDFQEYKDSSKEIKISESVTYVLSGENSEYKFVVDAKEAVIKIVLSNYSSNLSEFLTIKNARKVIIELRDGTTNKIDFESEELDKYIIDSKAPIEFIGKGILTINTSTNFINTTESLSFEDVTIELNKVNQAIQSSNNILFKSGIFYAYSNNGIICDGNFVMENGKTIIRSKETSIKANGMFLTNGGTLFTVGVNEIQKPNANSTQKSLILNFADEMSKILVLHNTINRVLSYEGGMAYKHILYSTDFQDSSFILYYGGKISGAKKYGLYEADDYAEDNQLTSTSDTFMVSELINIYDNIVKK